MNPLLMHSECLSEFNEQYFEKVINEEHITSDGSINFPKAKLTDGTEKEINFWGWEFTKNNTRWLVPNTLEDGTVVKLKDILPLIPSSWDTVGFQNKEYRLITEYDVVKFRSENRLGMRKLVDTINSIPHSNPKQRALLIMATLGQVFSRSYYRFSSPPSFGKDSIVDTMGLLIGGCATIENPSVPKLEREASMRTLTGLNEVVGLTRSQWTDIGKFMLAACAFKPSITKRTRAFGGVGETINLRGYSMSVFYNDIDCYNDKKIVYFDALAEEGIKDRLPSFRFHGHFTYDFNEINNIDVKEFVKEHMEDYKDLVYTITYYKDNFRGSVPYSYDISKFPQRWQRSIGILLKVLSLYVRDQEEFTEYFELLLACMYDYNCMVQYPKLYKALVDAKGEAFVNKMSDKLISDKFSDKVKEINDSLTGKEKVTEVSGYW